VEAVGHEANEQQTDGDRYLRHFFALFSQQSMF
jgi:hypothetical protein